VKKFLIDIDIDIVAQINYEYETIEDLHANSNLGRIILYAAILGVWRKSRGITHVCFPTIITLKYTA